MEPKWALKTVFWAVEHFAVSGELIPPKDFLLIMHHTFCLKQKFVFHFVLSGLVEFLSSYPTKITFSLSFGGVSLTRLTGYVSSGRSRCCSSRSSAWRGSTWCSWREDALPTSRWLASSREDTTRSRKAAGTTVSTACVALSFLGNGSSRCFYSELSQTTLIWGKIHFVLLKLILEQI